MDFKIWMIATQVDFKMTMIATQVEDKSREIERLRGSLGTAEARLGGLEGRWARSGSSGS